MTRINIYAEADPYGFDDGPADEHSYIKPPLIGWFDSSTAEVFEQGQEWDGNNMVGRVTGSEWIDEYLYRTKGGKWVLNHDAHRYMGGPDTYRFLSAAEARDWLLSSENHEAVERFFGEVPDEEDRRAGRPEIGGAVHLRLGDLLDDVDAFAAAHACSRAEAVRELVSRGLRTITDETDDEQKVSAS